MAKRVLVVASLGTGGVSTLMTNIQKRLDRQKVNFDYLVFHDKRPFKADMVESMGSRIYYASADDIKFRPLRRIVRMIRIGKVCRKNSIECMHYNADMPVDLTNIIAAKLGGVKHITIHAHNTSYTLDGASVKIMSHLFKPLFSFFGDAYWACSDLAGEFLYPKNVICGPKYKMVPNGIDLKKFDYNAITRKEIREKLELENKLVIGHAGRFVTQKNHKFLIDIFKEIQNKEKDSVLLLFGTGDLEGEIRSYASQKSVNVIFMGVCNEMYKMWQAIDVFVMPSFHEGLPVSGIEAQTSGVQCVFSDTITREVDVTNTSVFLSLDESPEKWANEILKYKNIDRTSMMKKMLENHYDIQQMTDWFQEYYLKV